MERNGITDNSRRELIAVLNQVDTRLAPIIPRATSMGESTALLEGLVEIYRCLERVGVRIAGGPWRSRASLEAAPSVFEAPRRAKDASAARKNGEEKRPKARPASDSSDTQPMDDESGNAGAPKKTQPQEQDQKAKSKKREKDKEKDKDKRRRSQSRKKRKSARKAHA
jgi:hypothetical protein